MAIVDVTSGGAPITYPFLWSTGSGSISRSSVTFSATITRIMGILTVPKAGNIRKIGWGTRSAATPQSIDVRLETIGASGLPSGTLWGTNTTGTVASPAANTNYWTTMTADATVSAGDRVAVVIQWTSTTGSVQVERHVSGVIECDASNYVGTYTSGSWAKAGNPPAFGLEYDDGTYGFANSFPPCTSTTLALNTGTTPDEAGLYFQLPFKCRLRGVQLVKTFPASATFAMKFYDSDGSTVLTSTTGIDSDWAQADGFFRHLFATSATIEANTNYRLTFLPETATSHSISYVDMATNTQLGCWPGGTNLYWTQRTDAGAWTETNTRQPLFWLLIDGIDYTAGGLLRHPGMMGGFNG